MRFVATVVALALCVSTPAAAEPANPMQFFEGRTESVGIIKLVVKKPFKSRAIGKGEIKSDGSLLLVQRVFDEGSPPRDRRWQMRRVGPGRYSGTMTEAKGPVVVDEIDGKYRFRFRMVEGNVSVEQWLIPSPDGRSAVTKTTIRKFGIRVGSSDGSIRKLD